MVIVLKLEETNPMFNTKAFDLEEYYLTQPFDFEANLDNKLFLNIMALGRLFVADDNQEVKTVSK